MVSSQQSIFCVVRCPKIWELTDILTVLLSRHGRHGDQLEFI